MIVHMRMVIHTNPKHGMQGQCQIDDFENIFIDGLYQVVSP